MSTRAPSVASLSFSPDGVYLAWLSNDAQLRIWDGRQVLPPFQMPGARHIAAGATAVAVSDDTLPIVRFVDPSSMALLPLPSRAAAADGPVVALTPPQAPRAPGALFGGLYALVQGFALRVRSYDGKNVAAFNNGAVAFCAVFDAAAERLAVGDNKGTVRVWDFLKRPPVCVAVRGHKSFVSSLAFYPDGACLVSGGWDGRVQVWDLKRELKSVVNIRAELKNGDKVHAVAVPCERGDAGLVATGGASGTVRVWRATDANGERYGSGELEPIAVHAAHSSSIYVLAFSPDGRHVASGSGDGTVRLFGVPSKPILISHQAKEVGDEEHRPWPSIDTEGVYQVQPMDMIIKGQRADRQLIFCPSNVVTLNCPVCTNAYDPLTRTPICSGACGHTFACRVCNDRLWDTDNNPKCPICRVVLLDVVPNYELLRVLSAAKGDGPFSTSTKPVSSKASLQLASTRASIGSALSQEDYVDSQRLSWMELPETTYMTRHSCVVFSGKMDGEVVAIRLPTPNAVREQSNGSSVQMTETERHIACLKRLRGPHIAQLYGVSRTEAPDNRVVVVSELPIGGTLASNLSSLRVWGRSLPAEAVLSLSLQIVKMVRFLHQSNTSAGWSLSPDAIALSMPIAEDWSASHRLKLLELGGAISKSECTTDVQRVFPSDYVGYMAPEMLDEDRSTYRNREVVFSKMCQSDMYSLGVVLWEIASAKRPFEGLRPAQVVAAVVGKGERPGYPPSVIPEELQTLISRLWSQEPGDRPNAREACELLETVPSAPPPS